MDEEIQLNIKINQLHKQIAELERKKTLLANTITLIVKHFGTFMTPETIETINQTLKAAE